MERTGGYAILNTLVFLHVLYPSQWARGRLLPNDNQFGKNPVGISKKQDFCLIFDVFQYLTNILHTQQKHALKIVADLLIIQSSLMNTDQLLATLYVNFSLFHQAASCNICTVWPMISSC